jgi:hypothetical protein
MKPVTVLAVLLVVSVFAKPRLSASDVKYPSAITASLSADDFDWREMLPYLCTAATLPEDDGVKTMLENSKILRAYLANIVREECRPGNDRCDSSRAGFTREAEITRRIDGIVQEGMIHRKKTASVDYPFDRKPFPFSQISALRSDKQQDAYVIVQFADHAYTADQVQAKYGAPYDTDIFGRYSVYKYRLQTARYTSKAIFEINPADGAVIMVAISLKTRKSH